MSLKSPAMITSMPSRSASAALETPPSPKGTKTVRTDAPCLHTGTSGGIIKATRLKSTQPAGHPHSKGINMPATIVLHFWRMMMMMMMMMMMTMI